MNGFYSILSMIPVIQKISEDQPNQSNQCSIGISWGKHMRKFSS